MTSNIYETHGNNGLLNEVLDIITAKKDFNTKSILDVGCGFGGLLQVLFDRGCTNLHGCDGYLDLKYSKDIIDFSKIDININLLQTYTPNSFDVITMVEVIEHLENPNFVVNDIHKLLKKDGYLIITTPNIHTLVSRLLFLIEGNLFLFRESDIRPKNCAFPNHIAPFFFYIFETLFKEKFKVVEKRYGNFVIPFTNIELPIKNRLFGNNIILVLQKR